LTEWNRLTPGLDVDGGGGSGHGLFYEFGAHARIRTGDLFLTN
jgi:hypothetical protein